MATGSRTYEGLAVPLLGESEIVNQTAATDILTIRQASGASGSPLVIRNSASTNKFGINSLGAIRTMVMGTIAIASLDSNASADVALTGATTKDVCMLLPQAGAVTGDAMVVGVITTADFVTVYAAGGATTANARTANVWLVRTA